MRFSGVRLARSWPLVLALVAGLAVAAFSARQLLAYARTHQEKVSVVVAARDIAPYEVIRPEDLARRAVVKGAEDPGAVKSEREAVGKVARSLILEGEQVRPEKLAGPEALKDRQVVALNVDLSRCAGGTLAPGDLVDVWWVGDVGAAPGLGWVKVSSDAIVLDVRDSSGRSLTGGRPGVLQQAAASLGQQGALPAVVVLAVKAADVSRVVGGASPKSQNVVLTKKFALGGGVEVAGSGEARPPSAGGPAPGGAAEGGQARPEAGH